MNISDLIWWKRITIDNVYRAASNWRTNAHMLKWFLWIMSDITAPIQIPSELNVPETTSENETIEPIKPRSAASAAATQSADGKQFPKHRLQKEKKSQSMFNFTVRSCSLDESQTNAETTGEKEPPTITLSPASATFRKSAEQKSTSSFDFIDRLTEPASSHAASAHRRSANRTRANSIATVDRTEHDADEFDELGTNGHAGSQLRIRSSIISLFGRMGKMRRHSTFSQNSVHETNETNEHATSLKTLPQIAATKILRAFSYVGKPNGTWVRRLKISCCQPELQLSFMLRKKWILITFSKYLHIFYFVVHERRIRANNKEYNSQFKYAVSFALHFF